MVANDAGQGMVLMRRPILTYGAPTLRRAAAPVRDVNGTLQALIDDMVETMYAAPGVGLAANQVGSLQRVFIANPSDDRDPARLVVVVNPELAVTEGELVSEEGCLSVPEFRENVRRARRVLLRGTDRHGRPLEIEAEDLLARIFQHEVDHLNGILFLDRLSPAKRLLLKPRLRKAFGTR
jgi:peptide deformylase